MPPAPPTLGVLATTGTTISVGWTPSVDGGSPLVAYRLHHHREFGDWDRTEVDPSNTTHTFDGLRCGTNYQFYIQAVNDFGVGERTETISANTRGSAPIPPSSSEDLIRVNSSSISLDLSTWSNGGCPISSFVVEYKVKVQGKPEEAQDDALVVPRSEDPDDEWILVNNNVKKRDPLFSVLDLNPGTRYKLRMTAHNAAGSTVVVYDFTTLTFAGATVAPELIIHSEYSGFFFTEPGILFPILLALVVIIVVVLLLSHRFVKDKFFNRRSKLPFPGKIINLFKFFRRKLAQVGKTEHDASVVRNGRFVAAVSQHGTGVQIGFADDVDQSWVVGHDDVRLGRRLHGFRGQQTEVSCAQSNADIDAAATVPRNGIRAASGSSMPRLLPSTHGVRSLKDSRDVSFKILLQNASPEHHVGTETAPHRHSAGSTPSDPPSRLAANVHPSPTQHLGPNPGKFARPHALRPLSTSCFLGLRFA